MQCCSGMLPKMIHCDLVGEKWRLSGLSLRSMCSSVSCSMPSALL